MMSRKTFATAKQHNCGLRRMLTLDEACRATKDRDATPVAYRLISRGTENAGYCHQDPPANVMPLDKVIDGMKTHLANVKIHHERGDQARWLREVTSFQEGGRICIALGRPRFHDDALQQINTAQGPAAAWAQAFARFGIRQRRQCQRRSTARLPALPICRQRVRRLFRICSFQSSFFICQSLPERHQSTRHPSSSPRRHRGRCPEWPGASG